ncbi:MAG: PfkB family carbohydrate kinase, partial [Bifidobacteriaceae bacterium]|nr:PfkB family carbohydrate kinase [Bifidobacteriaceae bacterium]
MNGRVVVTANAIVDLLLSVPRLPAAGGDVVAEASGSAVGGSGYNAAVAAARAGAEVLYAGPHGTGPFGDRVRAALAQEGIAVALPACPGADTGFSVALVTPDGERTFATAPGAEAGATARDLAAIRLLPGDVVHVSGYNVCYSEAVTAWLDGLDGSGGPGGHGAASGNDGGGPVVVFDPGPLLGSIPPDRLARALRRADWVTANEPESAQLALLSGAAGLAVMAADGDPNDPAGIAAGLARDRAGAIVRLGANGCVVAVPGAHPVHLAAPQVEAVDTNGAGDCHTGTFMAGLALGLDPVEAARRAG